MIVRRHSWFYRLADQSFAQEMHFDPPVTASQARDILRRSVGEPVDLWGRSSTDIHPHPK